MDEIRALERRVATLENYRAADVVSQKNIERRLDGIEDTLKWLVRLIIGSLILAAIGFAMKGGFGV